LKSVLFEFSVDFSIRKISDFDRPKPGDEISPAFSFLLIEKIGESKELSKNFMTLLSEMAEIFELFEKIFVGLC